MTTTLVAEFVGEILLKLITIQLKNPILYFDMVPIFIIHVAICLNDMPAASLIIDACNIRLCLQRTIKFKFK